MTEVAIYLFAPKSVPGRWGRERWVRGLKIEEATYRDDGISYTPGRTLVDQEISCSQDTPNECLVVRGHITGKF